jgi:transposase
LAKDEVSLSQKEVDRLGVIQAVVSGGLRQDDAAHQLGLSTRQVKRLVGRYRTAGAAGLVSRHRGRRPNNAIAAAVRDAALTLVRTHYRDFGPTLAHEKLLEQHGYRFSVETLRQWMIADGLWQPKRRRQARIHQRRPRRPCYGELIQVDGSPHDWFEGRAEPCCLIVFIDDATSELMALRFVPAETTQAYLETLREYLDVYGRPVAVYSDKHSIFRSRNAEQGSDSQFSRVLKTLDIEPIHAHTPQAKGRVERANQTLQDRLVKELRLHGINDIDTANAFLPAYRDDHNQRFAVAPQSPVDAHRSLHHGRDALALIFTLQHRRKLSKNLTCRFQNREYQVQRQQGAYRLRGATITVCEAFDGSVTLLYQGHKLDTTLLSEGERPIPMDDEKSLHATVAHAKRRQQAHKPSAQHPWRQPAVQPRSSASQP